MDDDIQQLLNLSLKLVFLAHILPGSFKETNIPSSSLATICQGFPAWQYGHLNPSRTGSIGIISIWPAALPR
jgi:hypothetical protein